MAELLNTKINGTLTVGDTTLNSNYQLYVNGNSKITGALSTTGQITTDSNGLIKGKLTIGQTDLNKDKALYVSGSTYISDSTWINSDLGVQDDINAKSAHLRDRLTIYPNTNNHYSSSSDSKYKLFVDGDSKIYGNLDAENDITTDSLIVAGTSNLNDTVNINTDEINLASNTLINIDENNKINVEIESIEENNTIIFDGIGEYIETTNSLDDINKLIIKEKNKNNIITSYNGTFSDTYESKSIDSTIKNKLKDTYFSSDNYIVIQYTIKNKADKGDAYPVYSFEYFKDTNKKNETIPFDISVIGYDANDNITGNLNLTFKITPTSDFLSFVDEYLKEFNYFNIADSNKYYGFNKNCKKINLSKSYTITKPAARGHRKPHF